MKGEKDENLVSLDGLDTDDEDGPSSVANGTPQLQNPNQLDLSELANLDFDALTELGLPDKLAITNVDDTVFDDEESKLRFQELFTRFDEDATFLYLKSFRRAQVSYTSIAAAVRARIELDNLQFGDKKMKCYFAQTVPQPNLVTDPYLLPPKPVKQFLISPPPSPPEGWEPIEELGPVMDYDLLTALAGLAPGEAHVVHPQKDDLPSIVVHICEDPVGFRDPTKPKIEQTRHPGVQ